VVTDSTAAARRSLPTGTVTFLRTDVEGSMRLMRELGAAWDSLNATHLGIIRTAIANHGGIAVRTEGDAVFAVFPEARAAVAAAIAAQQALAAHDWPPGAALRVRMGLHSGEAYLTGDDYGGYEVNRAARIAAAGHGGQIVFSDATRALVADALPDGVRIRDLGSHALRDVPRPERLYQLDIPGLQADFPALRTAAATTGDLPSRLTSFIGREAEIDEVTDLLAKQRLVTLTGPGGIGKTSLAVEAARRVSERFPDGAWFVPLAEVEDPSIVRSVVARTIGLHDGPGRSAAEALGPYLADRSVLLVIDNFEHLIDAVGDVGDILEASPASRIVVTSRAPLRIIGEQEYPVQPMGEACAQLFVDRARAIRPGWEAAGDRAVVDEVCSLLDRLPLGVELAAARVAHLPLTAIRDRLRAHLPLPGSGPRNVPDRQRTLAGAIAWSHDLLPPELQRVLHDLAVFEGGFDLEQAGQVVEVAADGDVLDHLVTLVDQSLIKRDATESGVRFDMLETIRAFALEGLRADGREGSVRRRHATAYLELAETAAPNLPGPDQPRWLDRLTLDYANLRSAILWTIDAGEVELALRFVAGMWRFWQQDGRLAEATELAETALAMPGADAPTPERMAAVAAAGGIAYWHGRQDDATRYYEEQLALARGLGDIPTEADALWNLSFQRFIRDDTAASNALLDQAYALFMQLGDERGAARVEWSRVTVGSGEHPAISGLESLESLIELFEDLNDTWYRGQTSMSIAWVHFASGDVAEASRWFIRSLVAYHSLRDVTGTTISIPLGALLALAADRPEETAMLMGASEHLTQLYGVKAPMGLQELLGASDPGAQAKEMLGAERYSEAFDKGRQMTLDQAVALIIRVQDEAWGPGDESAAPDAPGAPSAPGTSVITNEG
jgi:predicted ATPase/class 3 adenylate cyclase